MNPLLAPATVAGLPLTSRFVMAPMTRGRSPGGVPTPEVAAMVLEQCRDLLAALPDEELREIAVWKMEGYTRQEIADRLKCSPRTIAYRLEYIRKAWEASGP